MWTPGSGGGGGSGDTTGAASSTDNAAVRFDGAGGKTLQNSGVIISDANAVSGVTQLDVDNVRVDGNTVSTTNANGSLTLAPNGTGQVLVPSGSASAPGIGFTADPESGLLTLGNGVIGLTFDGSRTIELRFNRISLQRTDGFLLLGSDENFGYGWAAAAVGKLCAGTSGLGAARQGQEVLARTTDLILTTAESGILYTNNGASGQVIFTLPAATLPNNVGCVFGFCVRVAQNIRITAGAGDVINRASGATAAGGNINSATVRSMIWLWVSAAGFWDSQESGTWA